MVKYEKPVIKKAAEMQEGDVFQTEYGEYGNFVKAVCECVHPDGNHTKITCHWINSDKSFVMVSLEKFEEATFEVVGKIV